MKKTTDILVIGAGSAGLSVAAGAAQMGARAILLEAGQMGGDCLNYGCVPSKALLAAAKSAHSHHNMVSYGLKQAGPQVDFAKVKDHVADVIAQIAPHDSQERFEGLGVEVIRAHGRFRSATEVEAGEHVISARRIVIATGSSPMVPPIPGLATVPYLTNETLFVDRTAPQHLLIIGGGPIGLEMAQAHARLGAKVTVIEAAHALGKDDPEMVATLLEHIRAEGVDMLEGTAVTKASQNEGAITLTLADGREVTGSHLLVAAGRSPNIADLNLDAAGIAYDQRGIKVDDQMRTSTKKIYAIGDVAGGLQFTHVAGYHAGLVLRSALMALPARERRDHIPWVTYTDPELAQVGLTEDEARKKFGAKLQIARFDFAQNDRAIAERKSLGGAKVMVYQGRPVGATLLGHAAGEHINFWALALSQRLKMRHIAGMVAAYPTFGEINKRVAGAFFAPSLFENPRLKSFVRFVQSWVP